MIRFLLSLSFLCSISMANDRPLKAIALKEGNTCSLACLAIYDQNSDDLRACVWNCLEDARTRGGYPLELPKYSTRLPRPNGPSSKM